MQELGDNFAGCKLEIETKLSDEQTAWIENNLNLATIKNQNYIEIELADKEEIPALVKTLSSENIPIYSLKNRGGLEEWFLNITKK
jgi:hypothetical protein